MNTSYNKVMSSPFCESLLIFRPKRVTNSDPMTSKQFNKATDAVFDYTGEGVQGYLCRVMKRVGVYCVLLHLFKRDRVLLNGEIFSTSL